MSDVRTDSEGRDLSKAAPEMGPLDAGDFEIGKTWLQFSGFGEAVGVVTDTKENDLCVAVFDNRPFPIRLFTYEELRTQSVTYSNDFGKTWHPCEKPVK
mgnify:CR=1 FL=1